MNGEFTKTALLSVLLMSFAPGALHTVSAKECSAGHAKCRCTVGLLHPTQMSVGMIEVAEKVEQLKKKVKDGKLLSYLKKHREPVTIGPQGVLYITNHHHLAVALLNMGVDETYCRIEDNRSDEPLDVFWTRMVHDRKAWPKDGKGDEHAPTEIPASVGELQDDPYRSLAGEVRDACGFEEEKEEKTKQNFVEFEWADFFRDKIRAQLIQTNMDEAIKRAMKLAKSSAAKKLPGYPCKERD